MLNIHENTSNANKQEKYKSTQITPRKFHSSPIKLLQRKVQNYTSIQMREFHSNQKFVINPNISCLPLGPLQTALTSMGSPKPSSPTSLFHSPSSYFYINYQKIIGEALKECV